MSDFSLIPGKTLVIDFGPVTRKDPFTGIVTDLDLRAGGIRLRFAIKEKYSDPDGSALALLHFEAGVIETQGIVVPAVAGAPMGLTQGPPEQAEPWQAWETNDGLKHVQLPTGDVYSADEQALDELLVAAETSDWHAQVAAAVAPAAILMGAGGVANVGSITVSDDDTRTWPPRSNLPWELELRESAAVPAGERVTKLDGGWVRTGRSVLDTNP